MQPDRVVPGRRARRRLPSGRAVVGGLLVTIAAAGVLVAHRAASQPPTTRYLVTTRVVAAGQAIIASDLGAIAIDLPRDVSAIPATRGSELIGRVARTSLEKLDLLRPNDVLDPGRFADPDAVEVAVELPPGRALQGIIHAGSIVDVLSTDPEATTTSVLATGVRVTSTQTDDPDASIGSAGTVQVLLSVTGSAEATALVDAAIRSDITLVLPRPVEEGTA